MKINISAGKGKTNKYITNKERIDRKMNYRMKALINQRTNKKYNG
jgi:hypothetical protein